MPASASGHLGEIGVQDPIHVGRLDLPGVSCGRLDCRVALTELGGFVGLGNQQAGLLAEAGQYGTTSGSSNGGILSSLFSDRQLKTDIERVGTLDNGLPIYSFRYGGEGPITVGLMADDVEAFRPDAVTVHHTGFKMVDYGKAVQ